MSWPTMDIEAFRVEIHKVLRRLNGISLDDSVLSSWLVVRNMQRDTQSNISSAVRQVLMDALSRLRKVNPEGSAILLRHYVDTAEVHTIAGQMSMAEGTINKKQRQAVSQLADLLWDVEMQARSDRLHRLTKRLDAPTYLRLFGVERHIEQLAKSLQVDGPPWLIAIEGIGGIGKTALADSLVRKALDDTCWDEVIWLTARQQGFSARGLVRGPHFPVLTPEALVDILCEQIHAGVTDTATLSSRDRYDLVYQRLKNGRCIVVIDNLETVADVQSLLSTLRAFANPSKFLLTTRDCLYGADDVFHYRVSELSESSALDLIRWEAESRNLPHLADAPSDVLFPIYETVGGNPLALRLVAGQMHIHALKAVLDDLRTAQSRKVEGLFTYIYRRAWDNIDESARKVLLLMPLISEQGSDLHFLAGMSGIGHGPLRDALELLVTLNLVDRRGGIDDSRYTIHSLTRTFLHHQVLRWHAIDARDQK